MREEKDILRDLQEWVREPHAVKDPTPEPMQVEPDDPNMYTPVSNPRWVGTVTTTSCYLGTVPSWSMVTRSPTVVPAYDATPAPGIVQKFRNAFKKGKP